MSRSSLLRGQKYQGLGNPNKLGVGQNIALHASLAASNFIRLRSFKSSCNIDMFVTDSESDFTGDLLNRVSPSNDLRG